MCVCITFNVCKQKNLDSSNLNAQNWDKISEYMTQYFSKKSILNDNWNANKIYKAENCRNIFRETIMKYNNNEIPKNYKEFKIIIQQIIHIFIDKIIIYLENKKKENEKAIQECNEFFKNEQINIENVCNQLKALLRGLVEYENKTLKTLKTQITNNYNTQKIEDKINNEKDYNKVNKLKEILNKNKEKINEKLEQVKCQIKQKMKTSYDQGLKRLYDVYGNFVCDEASVIIKEYMKQNNIVF